MGESAWPFSAVCSATKLGTPEETSNGAELFKYEKEKVLLLSVGR